MSDTTSATSVVIKLPKPPRASWHPTPRRVATRAAPMRVIAAAPASTRASRSARAPPRLAASALHLPLPPRPSPPPRSSFAPPHQNIHPSSTPSSNDVRQAPDVRVAPRPNARELAPRGRPRLHLAGGERARGRGRGPTRARRSRCVFFLPRAPRDATVMETYRATASTPRRAASSSDETPDPSLSLLYSLQARPRPAATSSPRRSSPRARRRPPSSPPPPPSRSRTPTSRASTPPPRAPSSRPSRNRSSSRRPIRETPIASARRSPRRRR